MFSISVLQPLRIRGVILQFFRTKYLPRNLLNLKERGGFIGDTFPPESNQRMAKFMEDQPRVVYAGFDPTADSLHVGNLLVMMGLLHAQRSGHQAIALVGGATAKIGDPSGKSSERPQLSESEISENSIGIRKNLETVFQNHEKLFWDDNASESKLKPILILNNQDWYDKINLVHFLRNYGRHFRMNKLLSRDSVKSRLNVTKADPDGGMSFTEFSYQVFQSYDWLHLKQEYDCSIQIGGSDQMGNIVSGYELIQRVHSKKERDIYGILLPLLTTESGDKFGKSAGSPVWLSPLKMSPFEFYQFFIRVADSQVEEMLHFFTFLSLSHVNDLMSSHKRAPEKRKAQTKLAEQLTLLVHGQSGLELATKATTILFSEDGLTETLAVTSKEDLGAIFNQAPYVRLLRSAGMTLLQLAMKVGCFRTEKDAIRIIDAGGFYVNQVRRTNTDEIVTPQFHILPNNLTLIRVGKKNFYIVDWS